MTSQHDTKELPSVAFTAGQIQRGLEEWSTNLAKAKADGDIFAAETAVTWADTWLDRKLLAEASHYLARPQVG